MPRGLNIIKIYYWVRSFNVFSKVKGFILFPLQEEKLDGIKRAINIILRPRDRCPSWELCLLAVTPTRFLSYIWPGQDEIGCGSELRLREIADSHPRGKDLDLEAERGPQRENKWVNRNKRKVLSTFHAFECFEFCVELQD